MKGRAGTVHRKYGRMRNPFRPAFRDRSSGVGMLLSNDTAVRALLALELEG